MYIIICTDGMQDVGEVPQAEHEGKRMHAASLCLPHKALIPSQTTSVLALATNTTKLHKVSKGTWNS